MMAIVCFFLYKGICTLCLFNDSVGSQHIKKIIISLAVVGTTAIVGAIFLVWFRWRPNQMGKNDIAAYMLHCFCYLYVKHTLTQIDKLLSKEVVGKEIYKST